MGIREDIRSAFGSIATAIHEATATMRHGEESGTVAQASSRDFAEPVSADSPAETARFVADAADFPTLGSGAAVEIGDSLRVVVSLKLDPVGATYTIGVSDSFENVAVAYTGTRRENGAARQFSHPLDILIIENGVADNFADALAPTYAISYTAAIRRKDWPETTDPEPSDVFAIVADGLKRTVKVSAVTRHDGWYILKCRAKG